MSDAAISNDGVSGIVRVIDLETTDQPPDAGVVEVGWCDVHVREISPGRWTAVADQPRSMLVNPNLPIKPEAQAVHHISERDIAGAPPVTTAFMKLTAGDPLAFAAHNAKFEREFFAGGTTPWVCTYKAALRVYPDAPNHKNQTLRYWLGLHVDTDFAAPAHRAGPDAYVTAHLLAAMLNDAGADLREMIRWTKKPGLLPGAINFGKHKGTPWSDLPTDYLKWMAGAPDMDKDRKFTAKHHLENR